MKLFTRPKLRAVQAFLLFFVLLPSVSLLAKEELVYDSYTVALREPSVLNPEIQRTHADHQLAARILEQPFRPAGHAIGKSAEWVERHHIDDKTIWFFDKLALQGIFPSLHGPNEGSFGTTGIKGRIEIDRLLKMEQRSISLNAFGAWAPSVHFGGSDVYVGTNYELTLPEASWYHKGLVRYARSSSESFYGIGNDTSRGSWSTYQPEELKLEGTLGTKSIAGLDLNSAFTYQKMNIGNGARPRVWKIKNRFLSQNIPGINGGDLIGIKAHLSYDFRDRQDEPKSGGYGKLEIAYNHDTGGEDFQYLTLSGSLAHFFKLWSDRRVLAFRFLAETNQDLAGGDVPFFNMARLGGSKPWAGSELLRSYRFNRFFDSSLTGGSVEYRYNVYQYGDFGANAFGLFDVGEVFDGIRDFSLGELVYSYGGGLDIKFRGKTLLTLALAHGNEGSEFEVNSKSSF